MCICMFWGKNSACSIHLGSSSYSTIVGFATSAFAWANSALSDLTPLTPAVHIPDKTATRHTHLSTNWQVATCWRKPLRCYFPIPYAQSHHPVQRYITPKIQITTPESKKKRWTIAPDSHGICLLVFKPFGLTCFFSIVYMLNGCWTPTLPQKTCVAVLAKISPTHTHTHKKKNKNKGGRKNLSSSPKK